MNMHKYIDYLFNSSHEIYKMIYHINNKVKIRIFWEEFVCKNRSKCSIIYKDKIFPLQSYFLIKDINKEYRGNKIFQMLLLELEDISDKVICFILVFI